MYILFKTHSETHRNLLIGLYSPDISEENLGLVGLYVDQTTAVERAQTFIQNTNNKVAGFAYLVYYYNVLNHNTTLVYSITFDGQDLVEERR